MGVSLIQDTERGGSQPGIIRNTAPLKMQFVLKTIFAVLFCVAMVSALPKPMEVLDIYKKCQDIFGRKPRVACRSSSDCRLQTNTKCPEHDCLPNRKGKSFCTWQVY